MIEQIFKIEKGFINTKHPDFVHQRELILGNRAFAEKPGSHSRQSEQPQYTRPPLEQQRQPKNQQPEKENGFWSNLFGPSSPKKSKKSSSF